MTQRPFTLGELLASEPGAFVLGALPVETIVTGVSADSRKVAPGSLFFALAGARADGAAFIGDAAGRGALAAVVSLRAAAGIAAPAIPLVVVPDPRATLARCAARGRAQPATLVAITGTSGKTSVADFTRQIWGRAGVVSASLGTLGVLVSNAGEALASGGGLTTPDPVVLHDHLDALAAGGVTHAALEASSHGLDQRRLEGVRLSAAALTNIARDHLDYHPDEGHYAAAKLRLLTDLMPRGAMVVLNADDPRFALAQVAALSAGCEIIAVGHAGEALRLETVTPTDAGQDIAFQWHGVSHRAHLPLIGDFQAMNALMAAALTIATGSDPAAAFGALEHLSGAPGRMELTVRRENGARVFVDYAHKPDAVQAAVEALRAHTPGRLHLIIGAGGDRDPGKRILMGRAAARADRVIVTDDNPRGEDPATIRRAVLEGVPGAEEIGDRAEAILTGVDALEPGDALLIAGKGHETGQIIGGDILPFDDREQARIAVAVLDGDDV